MSRPKISKDYQDGYDLGYKNGYVEGAKDYQPKKGEWKLDSLGAYCSECKIHPDYTTNFCPNCGSDMRSAQNLSYADNDTAQGGLASAT